MHSQLLYHDVTTRLLLSSERADRLGRDYRQSQKPPRPDGEGGRLRASIVAAFAGRRRRSRRIQRALA